MSHMHSDRRKYTRTRGFSIVELVVVIVLIGLVGAVIVPRFMEPNAFNEAAAQDALLTSIREAQQAALGRELVTFTIEPGGGDWNLVTRHGVGGTLLRGLEISGDDVVLHTGAPAGAGDCGGANFDDNVAGDFSLAFSGTGDLLEFTNAGDTAAGDDLSRGVRICVNDTPALSVCVSPAGYAYAGNCDA